MTATMKKKRKKSAEATGKAKKAKKTKSKEAPAAEEAEEKLDPKAEAALKEGGESKSEVRAKLKQLANTVDESYMELGRLLYKVKVGKLYEEWGHESFETYVEAEIPNCGDRKAKYLFAIWKTFTVDLAVPRKKLERIGWTKAKELLPVLDKDGKNLEKWLDHARNKSVKELQGLISKAKGGKGKGDDSLNHTFSVKLSDEQWDNVSEAFEQLKSEAGSDAKGHLLDLLCTHYRNAKIPAGKKLAWLLKQIERAHGVTLIGCENPETAKRILKLLKGQKKDDDGEGAEESEASTKKGKKGKKKKRKVEAEEATEEEVEEVGEEAEAA